MLVLAVGLVGLTRGPTQDLVSPAPVAAPADPLRTASPEPAPAPAAAAREAAPRPPAPRDHAMPAPSPVLAPGPVRFDREFKRDADGKLVPIIHVRDLRDQLSRTDAAMTACIERSGSRPTGKATLSFIVAPKDGKLVIETTGVQDEETLAGHPDLLECMHQTANQLVVDQHPIPELGTPIYVRRHVRIENGVLAENTIFNFSYIP